jgi:hypothetical protein
MRRAPTHIAHPIVRQSNDTTADAALYAHLGTARVICCKSVAATSLVSSNVALNDRAASREFGDQQRGKTVTDLGVRMEI